MNSEPYGITIFCDDIRHEVTGKMTLVGCYTGELNFTNPAPGMLPTLAALINLRIPLSENIREIKISITKEESGEITEMFSSTTSAEPEQIKKLMNDNPGFLESEKLLSLNLPCQWSSAQFLDDAILKVRARIDGGKEIKLGALRVNFPSASDNKLENAGR